MKIEEQRNTVDYREEGITNLSKAKNHFWYLHRNRVIEDLIDQSQKGNKRTKEVSILEFGAGSGNISSYLFSKGYMIVASDYYQSGVEMIESNGVKAFQYDLVQNAPLQKEHINSYDIVILGDLIEHLDDPVTALMNAKRFLRKGGAIVITVPALSILWTKYDVYGGHKRRYSIRLLAKHVHAAGYRPIKIRYFMFLPAMILLVVRKLRDISREYNLESLSRELDLSPTINTFFRGFMAIEYTLQRSVYVPSIYCLAKVKNENRVL